MPIRSLLAYSWLWIKPSKRRKIKANKMFDLADFPTLKYKSYELAKFDPLWFPRLFEPTTLGIRTWEYGLLLDSTGFRKKCVLDAGCGNSRLPLFLAKKGAKVTLLDMKDPLEETAVKRHKNLRFVLGDMTKLSFADNHFDRVVCISAIEHVDMKSGGKFYSEKEYISRALKTIRELARVTKIKGVFYLTTDFYLPKQKTDKWPGSKDGIRGAFPWSCLSLFVEEMKKNGINLDREPEIDGEILIKSKSRANYRGRYITTVAFRGVRSLPVSKD